MEWFLTVVSAGLVGGSISLGPMSQKDCLLESREFRVTRCQARPAAPCEVRPPFQICIRQ